MQINGWSEQMLIGIGLEQGVDWKYEMVDGKMEAVTSPSGINKLIDACAKDQKWKPGEAEGLKQDFRRILTELLPNGGVL